MKTFLCLLLSLCSYCTQSQPIVLPLQKSLDLSISKSGDERQYVSIPENIKVLDQLKLKYREAGNLHGYETDSIRKVLINSVTNALDLQIAPELMVNAQVCFNENGEISHFFYYIKPFFFKNIDQSLQDKLPAELTRVNFKLKSARSSIVQVAFYIRLKSKSSDRIIQERDSLISTLHELQSTSDSLSIKRINLSSLELDFIPEEIYRFPNLEELDLHNNNISKVNLTMRRLPKLMKIDLSSNQLDEKNIIISKNKSLNILNLQKNAISDIPDAVHLNRKLQSLWLGGNILTSINSGSFRKFRNLEDLNLYNNALTTLPKGLKKLRHLKVIDLYYNEFREIPLVITKLKRLETLAIAHNQLNDITSKITRLHKLQTLYIHHNLLTTMPENISKMKNLNKLDIGYNNFQALPSLVFNLLELEDLDVSFNSLSDFPINIVKNKNLKTLFIKGNPFLKRHNEDYYMPFIEKIKDNGTQVYY